MLDSDGIHKHDVKYIDLSPLGVPDLAGTHGHARWGIIAPARFVLRHQPASSQEKRGGNDRVPGRSFDGSIKTVLVVAPPGPFTRHPQLNKEVHTT